MLIENKYDEEMDMDIKEITQEEWELREQFIDYFEAIKL